MHKHMQRTSCTLDVMYIGGCTAYNYHGRIGRAKERSELSFGGRCLLLRVCEFWFWRSLRPVDLLNIVGESNFLLVLREGNDPCNPLTMVSFQGA